jgi:hypothetical protein
MAHFFISYTGADVQWAEWIAWVLEDAGHSVILQKWDFRPGGNFIVQMQDAAAKADRTIAVLSPDYLKSGFATPEWAAAFVNDPTGSKLKLVPVRVRECNPDGLLKAVVYIDLVGADEHVAKQRLLDGLSNLRAKPATQPRFPGQPHSVHPAAPFPGPSRATVASREPYRPKIRSSVTELDQRRFLQAGFKRIREYFEHGLLTTAQSHPQIETEITDATAIDFQAEIFVDGKSRCSCRIWLGGMFGHGISYAEGPSIRGDAMNESLSVSVSRGEIAFRALMGGSFGRLPEGLDASHLTVEEAAEYLWRRFVTPLEF